MTPAIERRARAGAPVTAALFLVAWLAGANDSTRRRGVIGAMPGPVTRSRESAIDGIAQPTLNDLGVHHLDMECRLEPCDATGQPEIMEWRTRPFTSLGEQLLGGAQSETPFDGAAPQQAPAVPFADENAGEGGRQAEDAPDDESALPPDLALNPASRRSTARSRDCGAHPRAYAHAEPSS